MIKINKMLLLPPARVVCGKLMFSVMSFGLSVCQFTGGFQVNKFEKVNVVEEVGRGLHGRRGGGIHLLISGRLVFN